jgi:hypothetical protein
MNQAYLQLLGVLFGGGIALGGSILAHQFARSRDSRNRQVDGLREVSRELEKRVRLSLDIVQHVNLGMRQKPPGEFARDAFQIDGWKEVTLTLQERPWRFACMAFLPEALTDFEALDINISRSMDVHVHPLVDGDPHPQEQAAIELRAVVRSIEKKIEERLGKLLK